MNILTLIRCRICDGMGRVAFIGEDDNFHTKRCENCNGRGKIIDHDESNCEICESAD